jgi:hypothetical protein
VGYQTFSGSPKALVKSEDIGNGQININHLSPALYTEFRKIGLHSHSGQGSRRIELSSLTGAFGSVGFYMYSDDGTLWQVTIANDGTVTTTEV